MDTLLNGWYCIPDLISNTAAFSVSTQQCLASAIVLLCKFAEVIFVHLMILYEAIVIFLEV
jgi:hypothetical protein